MNEYTFKVLVDDKDRYTYPIEADCLQYAQGRLTEMLDADFGSDCDFKIVLAETLENIYQSDFDRHKNTTWERN